MKITILGSGTSTGVPMVGCSCDVCRSTDSRDKRTRTSILVQHLDQYLLIDTSTDLRQQAIREQIPRIDAILFTHHHADHIHGIDDLRGFHFIHKQIIPCYGTAETITAIGEKFNYIFEGLPSAGYHQLLEPHEIASPFTATGMEIIPVPLLHGPIPATGYRIGSMAYLTDCSAIPDSSLPLLQGLELLIIDGLRYTPHPHHFNIPEAIAASDRIQPARTVITHLTHEVRHTDEADLPDRFCFAYDGMVFDL